MKAIILAAGKGTRLQPLTLETPKAMVEVFQTPLLAYNMERLLPYVSEFIIVVKYKQEKITQYFGEEFHGKKITYHQQGEKKGTAGALEGLQVEGDYFVLASDTLYSQKDVDMLASHTGYAALAQKVEQPEKYGIFKTNNTGTILGVVEKPKNFVGNLASLFFFKVNQDLVSLAHDVKISSRGEYELTDALNIFMQQHTVQALEIQDSFYDITSTDDLLIANTLQKTNLGTTRFLENIGEYELHLGIPKNGAQQIVDYTLDTTDIALREGTSDWKKRFISVENVTSWYTDNDRYPFTLLDKQATIVGIWWGRPAKLPHISEILDEKMFGLLEKNAENLHTSGIRIYPVARGKGLAGSFIKACCKYYGYLFPNFCMSDDINTENLPSIRAFEKLGYQKVGIGKNVNNSPDSEQKRLVYIKKY